MGINGNAAESCSLGTIARGAYHLIGGGFLLSMNPQEFLLGCETLGVNLA